MSIGKIRHSRRALWRFVLLPLFLISLAVSGLNLAHTQHAAAAPDYNYTNNKYEAIQGTNPWQTSGQSATVTYRKVNDPSQWYGFGHGVYLDLGTPVPDNHGGFCYPTIQTNNKQYNGDTNARVYLECGGDKDHSDKRDIKNITVGKNFDNPNGGGGAGGGGGDGGDTTTCDSSGGGIVSFNWMLCPIYEYTKSLTDSIFNSAIAPLLITNPICLPSAASSCDTTIYKVWSGFRIYGDIFLVIALLVIVFGESIGGGLIDAYAAKKILPRLLIAAILINLSIYIAAFVVDITNVVGGGVGQLLTTPAHNGTFNITPSGGASIAITGGSLFVGLSGAALLGLGGIAMLLAGLGLTAIIAIVGVFVTLVIRQSIILALVIVSPVAFALWCLPNTEQWFKRWWDTFFQMMLVYPMIVVLFAVADILSAITSASGSGVLSSVVSFLLLVVPLYLVPFTLRSSNRLLGSIHGAVSNVGRQVNAVTGRRAIAGVEKRAGQNLELMQTNRRFNPHSRYLGGINRRLNSALSNITSPEAAAKIYGGSALRKLGVENSMGRGIMNQIEQTQFDHTQKLGEKLNQLGFNDRALRTLMGMDDYSVGAIRAKATQLRASDNPNDRLAANQLESSAQFLSQNLYKDADMGRADIGMAAGLAVTAQGFSNSDEVADLANRRGGQGSGVASAFVTQAQLNGQRSGMLDMKAGYGIQVGRDGHFLGIGGEGKSAEEHQRAVAHQIRRIMTTGQSELQSAKGGSVAAMSPGFEQILSTQGPPNADGTYEFKYLNENGEEETLKYTPQEVQRVAAMLGTAQADYSGTSASTNTAIQQILNNSHLSNEAQAAYQRGRRDVDASRRGGIPEEE